MTKKALVGLATVVALAVVGAAVVREIPRPGASRDDYDRLRPGMNRTEVEAVLHGPPRDDLAHPAFVWIPQATGKPISARITPGRPAPFAFARGKEDKPPGAAIPGPASSLNYFPGKALGDDRQAVWVAGTGLVAVHFRNDGKLALKYFSIVQETPGPTLGGWLAFRGRMVRQSLGL